MPAQTGNRRRRRRRTPIPNGAASLHIFEFRFARNSVHQRLATVLVRGRMDQIAAIPGAYEQARAQGAEPWCANVRSVPAPRPAPALDALCRRHTAFTSFGALLTAAAGYRPTIRLDLTGRDGVVLARAYDATQARWGDPRRAFVTGQPRQPRQRKRPDAGSALGKERARRRMRDAPGLTCP